MPAAIRFTGDFFISHSLKPACPYWTDKVALITGGSGGLGSSLGEAFAAAGAKVVLAARNIERLEAVVARIRKYGIRSVFGRCRSM